MARIALGDPGPCSSHGTLLQLLLDESASVSLSGGNDPLSRRHQEAAHAIRHVAQACRCRREKVTIVPFDQPSPGFVPPQSLTKIGQRRLIAGLRAAPQGAGSSELGAALSQAEIHASTYPGNVALVIFSDFLLTDADPGSVLARVASFPGYVHVVVLGARPPAVFRDDPHIGVSAVTPASLTGAVAQAVFDGLTCYRVREGAAA